MKIYAVQIEGAVIDGWTKYRVEKIISYHATKKGAEDAAYMADIKGESKRKKTRFNLDEYSGAEVIEIDVEED